MSLFRENRELLSVLIDIQDGLFELKQDLLLVSAARLRMTVWKPSDNEEDEDEISTLALLLDAFLDREPRGKIKELIEMTKAAEKAGCS